VDELRVGSHPDALALAVRDRCLSMRQQFFDSADRIHG